MNKILLNLLKHPNIEKIKKIKLDLKNITSKVEFKVSKLNQ